MDEPKIYTTVEWGARPPRGGGFARHEAEGIVVHHTADPNRLPEEGDREIDEAFNLARRIQNHHMDSPDRMWADTGEHFTISRGGLILEGRHGTLVAAREGEVVRGAHASSVVRYNTRWFGIEIEGVNLDACHVTKQQWNSLIDLCAWLSVWGRFDAARIIGHTEVLEGHTLCPGRIMDRLEELRAEVRALKEEILAREV